MLRYGFRSIRKAVTKAHPVMKVGTSVAPMAANDVDPVRWLAATWYRFSVRIAFTTTELDLRLRQRQLGIQGPARMP